MAQQIGITARAGTDKREGWMVVAAAVLTLTFGPSSILILSFGAFAQQLHGSFGWPVGKVALGSAIISIMIAIISPLQGWIADRFGARRLLLATLPVWGAGLAAMTLLPNSLTIYYIACALLPICGLGLWPLVQLKIVSTWFDRHLGLALGLSNTGLGIGAALLPIGLQLIFARSGWRMSYLVLAATIFIVVLPVAVWKMRENRPGVHEGVSLSDSGQEASQALRSRAFLLVASGFCILGAVSSGLLINFVSILVASGFTPARAVAIQSTLGVGSIAGRVGMGWLLDHVHSRWIGLGLPLTGALACLLLLTPTIQAWAGSPLLAAILLGIIIGAEFDLLAVAIRRYHGLRAFGRLFGSVFALFQIGGAIGVAVVALSFDAFGNYGAALLALSAVALLASLLLGNLGPYPPTKSL